MAQCRNCGQELDPNSAFCQSCGTPIAMQAEQPTPPPEQPYQQQYQQAPPPPPPGQNYQQYQQAPPPHGQGPAFMNTPEATAQFHPQDIQNNKMMAVLAYIGILVLVPLFAAKESPFAKYHTNQGLVLFIIEIAGIILLSILTAIMSWRLLILSSLLSLIFSLAFLAWSIIGIINAAGGKAKELPLIGKIKLLK